MGFAAISEEPLRGVGLAGYKILLVHGNTYEREATALALSLAQQHTVMSAGCVEEALHTASVHRPAVAIVDTELRGGSRRDLVCQMWRSNSTTEVVYITGGSSHSVESALLDDAVDVLTDPTDTELLLRVMSRAVSRHRVGQAKWTAVARLVNETCSCDAVSDAARIVNETSPIAHSRAVRIGRTVESLVEKLEMTDSDRAGLVLASRFSELRYFALPSSARCSSCEMISGINERLERFDGFGWPTGHAGEAIYIGARVLAVAHGFHSLIDDRASGSGMSVARALKRIKREAGRRYDPRVVDALECVTNPNERECRDGI
jgi:response regulator RpfG family c-di-GMP phosphodiesterase